MNFPSSVVRLTVPISAELSERLSVLAFMTDRTRSQYVRRAILRAVSEDIAALALACDLPPAAWYAECAARYRNEHSPQPSIDSSNITTADR